MVFDNYENQIFFTAQCTVASKEEQPRGKLKDLYTEAILILAFRPLPPPPKHSPTPLTTLILINSVLIASRNIKLLFILRCMCSC